MIRLKEHFEILLFSLLFSFLLLFLTRISESTACYVLISQIAVLEFVLHQRSLLYSSKVRGIIQNVSLLLVAVFIVICIFEVYLHWGKPGFLKLNESILCKFSDFTERRYLGEDILKKEKGVFRILGLGDSFAQVGRPRNNYHNFIGNKLDLKYGQGKVEVINAGMPNIGPGYYWGILRQYGDRFRPDLVLVGFFVGNDFGEMDFNTLRYGPFIKEPISKNAWDRWRQYFRFRNFWMYQFFANTGKVLGDAAQQKKEIESGIVKEKGVLSKKAFLRIERDRMHICKVGNEQRFEKSWNNNAKVLLAMKKWCDQRKVPLVVAIFPDQFQVNAGLRNEVVEAYNLHNMRFDFDYPNRLLMDFCKKHEIMVVDLLPTFLLKGQLTDLYLPLNTHWNKEGNWLAADVIYHYLMDNKLINVN